MMRAVLFVAIGGAAGSVLRYLSSVAVNKYVQSSFPWATFAVNIAGCFLIGLLMGFFMKQPAQDDGMKWLLVTGFCGGFTTFSAFAHENVALFQTQQYGTAFLYTALSVVLGMLAVWLGLLLTR
ncbi:Fluoride-specific ion channel FluC [Flavobacterium longum]|uniref:fluoride efflux transporter CrcB n=1 Tax=Flavobacterium longum TaxID=1299340 RepID=UPI0039EA8F73